MPSNSVADRVWSTYHPPGKPSPPAPRCDLTGNRAARSLSLSRPALPRPVLAPHSRQLLCSLYGTPSTVTGPSRRTLTPPRRRCVQPVGRTPTTRRHRPWYSAR